MAQREADTSSLCMTFILEQLKDHKSRDDTNPLFIGLNGIQGSGKSTLVSALYKELTSPPHSLSVATLSIDDLYLTHEAQSHLARNHPNNALIQHRGQPSTHDVPLGLNVLQALKGRKTDVHIPSYDKSAFNGEGDRRPETEWTIVNAQAEKIVDIIIFEGWCVGFRSLGSERVIELWQAAKEQVEADQMAPTRLGRCRLEDIEYVNVALEGYDVLTNFLDVMIQLDAEDTMYVYAWRQEQEAMLRADKGSGMTEEQVHEFVNGYYPSYELFTEGLRQGIFPNTKGRQLRLVLDKERRVVHTETI